MSSSTSTRTTVLPQPGQAVLVRGRPAAVRDVRPDQSDGGASHLVEVDYLDGWEFPADDTVLWEVEVDAQVLRGAGLPRVGEGLAPDPPERFAAFCDAIRWSSVARLPGLTGEGTAIVSPWESAVAPEPYQLYPVLKALEMPRVSLLLADDVGLGKTIEAGLVLRELLARRRIRRALVVCPASLQLQWQDELRTKFSLDFAVLDRSAVVDIQREYGMDANPWAVTPRAISSMDFLRQPDVLADFLAAAQRLERGHALAWDLLIVDEAHNLAPLGFSDRSDRARMLGEVAQHAEHRLFLSATPHNGFTASFSGLLEQLDPVRFRQTAELNEAERRQVELVMVRRLKSELNARARSLGQQTPFTERSVESLSFAHAPEEARLAQALGEYRRAASSVLASLDHRERAVGRFVFSLLTKRLLSSAYALARTWWKHVEGFEGTASLDEAATAQARAQTQTADDEEKARREEDVLRHGAAWLSRHEHTLRETREEVGAALTALGWGAEVVDRGLDPETVTAATAFPLDGKWEALRRWLDERLAHAGDLGLAERAIWFTEYKDTLDYLSARLAAEGMQRPEVRTLFGGSSFAERAEVRQAFNDDQDPVRLLVATDVAAEGLNLQTSCRLVVHYEVPWNPTRLEQRNGRVDRHGQARDVIAFHFASEEDEDVAFLDYVVRKIEQVRDDLGSVGEVIDRALDERFADGDLPAGELDRRIEHTRANANERLDLGEADEPLGARAGEHANEVLEETAGELRVDPERMRRLLEVAVSLDGGALEPAGDGAYSLRPVPPGWQRTVDTSLRAGGRTAHGALPRLVFSPEALMEAVGERRVYRERPDMRLMRLAQPVMRRAAATLRRRLWEAPRDLHRFTIAAHPAVGRPTLVVPALATLVNDLREPLHAELIELAIGVETLQPVETAGDDLMALERSEVDRWRAWLEDRWESVSRALRSTLDERQRELRERAEALLPPLLLQERARQEQLFDARIKELDHNRGERGRERLRRQIEKLEEEMQQLTFDEEHRRACERQLRQERERLEAEEYRRVEQRRERLRARVVEERDHLVRELLPRRFTLTRCNLAAVAVALVVPPGATP